MANFLNVHLTETGYWWDGNSENNYYSTDTPIASTNDILDLQINNTMTLVNRIPAYPRDIQSSKGYWLEFNTPNDGLSRIMQFDVGLSVSSNTNSGITAFWFADLFDIYVTSPTNNFSHPFMLPGIYGWYDAPNNWDGVWTTDTYHYIPPNALVGFPVGLEYGYRDFNSYTAHADFSWYITITCLNPSPPSTANNVCRMIVEQN
jgi:hypothetical protein